MKIIQKTLSILTLPMALFAGAAAHADVICGPNGWSCHTTAYPCEDIEVPSGSRCFGIAPQGAIMAKDREAMLVLDGKIASQHEAAEAMRRKPKMHVILPDPKVKK